MTFRSVIITLIIGILMIISAKATKKKWLKKWLMLISIIPLVIALGGIY